jgi:hypothetical protein
MKSIREVRQDVTTLVDLMPISALDPLCRAADYAELEP